MGELLGDLEGGRVATVGELLGLGVGAVGLGVGPLVGGVVGAAVGTAVGDGVGDGFGYNCGDDEILNDWITITEN